MSDMACSRDHQKEWSQLLVQMVVALLSYQISADSRLPEITQALKSQSAVHKERCL
jgi:hypothetical protein